MAHNPRVFLDVSIGGERTGRIVLELFDKEAPKTAEKFRALCTGERGIHLKGSPFGRIVPEFMCCGGEGIGEEPDFPVERSKATRSFIIGGGVLCTAHAVPDGKEPYACDAGFFITTKKTPILNRDHHTIFGKVVSGMDVVKAMEQVGSRSGTTKKTVLISDCGMAPAPRFAPGSVDGLFSRYG